MAQVFSYFGFLSDVITGIIIIIIMFFYPFIDRFAKIQRAISWMSCAKFAPGISLGVKMFLILRSRKEIQSLNLKLYNFVNLFCYTPLINSLIKLIKSHVNSIVNSKDLRVMLIYELINVLLISCSSITTWTQCR